ncbi:hypothetical protein D3C86_2004470 [compost metagenome]
MRFTCPLLLAIDNRNRVPPGCCVQVVIAFFSKIGSRVNPHAKIRQQRITLDMDNKMPEVIMVVRLIVVPSFG